MAETAGAPGNQRKVKNFLLQPMLQVRIGLYNVVLSAAFGMAVFGLLHIQHQRTEGMLQNLGHLAVDETVQREIEKLQRDQVLWFGSVTVIFVAASVLMSIVFTHRLVGPSYAFRRHLTELAAGNYAARVNLRRDDAFLEVADDLNRLAATLEATHGKRQPEASPPEDGAPATAPPVEGR